MPETSAWGPGNLRHGYHDLLKALVGAVLVLRHLNQLTCLLAAYLHPFSQAPYVITSESRFVDAPFTSKALR